jgi:hypothetical protein
MVSLAGCQSLYYISFITELRDEPGVKNSALVITFDIPFSIGLRQIKTTIPIKWLQLNQTIW